MISGTYSTASSFFYSSSDAYRYSTSSRDPNSCTMTVMSHAKNLLSLKALLLFLAWAGMYGCGSTNPLSIRLYNAKTNTLRTCAARESSPNNTEMLASIVEVCAKQLEAHGFVRVADSFNPAVPVSTDSAR